MVEEVGKSSTEEEIEEEAVVDILNSSQGIRKKIMEYNLTLTNRNLIITKEAIRVDNTLQKIVRASSFSISRKISINNHSPTFIHPNTATKHTATHNLPEIPFSNNKSRITIKSKTMALMPTTIKTTKKITMVMSNSETSMTSAGKVMAIIKTMETMVTIMAMKTNIIIKSSSLTVRKNSNLSIQGDKSLTKLLTKRNKMNSSIMVVSSRHMHQQRSSARININNRCDNSKSKQTISRGSRGNTMEIVVSQIETKEEIRETKEM